MSNTEIHKDRFGIPIQVGDTVVVSYLTGRSTVSTYMDEIIGFTPQKVRLKRRGLRDKTKVVLYNKQQEYNLEHFPEYII